MVPTETVLQEADRITSGDRPRDYGHPLDNFTFIGDLWQAYLRNRLRNAGKAGGEYAASLLMIRPDDVALMCDLLKVAREANTPKRDNRVDGPGYWKCLDLIVSERAERAARAERDKAEVQSNKAVDVPPCGQCGKYGSITMSRAEGVRCGECDAPLTPFRDSVKGTWVDAAAAEESRRAAFGPTRWQAQCTCTECVHAYEEALKENADRSRARRAAAIDFGPLRTVRTGEPVTASLGIVMWRGNTLPMVRLETNAA